ncbi:MAG: hypothetical protein AAFR98_02130 [Pseudomonadota bacterium]
MSLSAPTKWVFLVSFLFAILGFLPLVGIAVPVVTAYNMWMLVAGYVVLALGCLLKGF